MALYKCEHRDVSLFSVDSPPAKCLQSRIVGQVDEESSLVEMFVGIICACMPAAAHTCRHHLPSYDCVSTTLRSRYESLGKGLRRTNPTSSLLSKRGSRDVKTPRGAYEGYYNLGRLQRDLPFPAKSLQTYGRTDDLNYDGIHLTYEMQQTSTPPTPQDRGQPAI